MVALASLAGCGSSGPSDTQQVRTAVTRFAKASAKKDYQQICDRLVSRSLIQTVEQIGLPCEAAFRRGLKDVRKPSLQIRKVRVSGTHALVSIHSTAANQKPSDDTLELIKEDGDWRIASLAAPEPAKKKATVAPKKATPAPAKKKS
jgi:hypothetical protein